jgi:2-phospho-L-lactate/phosphoenolpyruvate guanylyltransferase
MKTVLLPVKDFKDAKQRLASTLNAQQRARLACAMLADVLDALSAAAEPSRVIVYTASEEVMRLVRPFGFEVLRERSVDGHSAAVNAVLPTLLSTSTRVLVIASDLPHLSADEIDRALTIDCQTIALMPSRDGTGTNGLVVSPPSMISMQYGDGSFRRHCDAAMRAGLDPVVLNLPGVAFDIDTAEDLELFREDPRLESETWRFLRTGR